ncbi:MAG: signal transduction histidine kinase [Sulfurimonas sp.]|jgi:signal transduction histidine kinase|uniref:sensor histidine kinase n=1 Tax=Sulfurimonas sp. TaxID=2022749 RepID=UPI0039E3EEE0
MIIKEFFTPKDTFSNDEWVLKHQIFALLIISFSLGLGILFFAIYRVTHGSVIAGVTQFLFSFFLLFGFIKLRKDKNFYTQYSILFFLFFFIYILIVFFFVPQNHLNILWIVTAPVLIFFFLDKKGGIIIFILLLGFVGYLLVIEYPYTIAEYITLFAVLTTSTLIMFAYEKIKDVERNQLLSYNLRLEKEIEGKTFKLRELNNNLKIKVEEEVEKRITNEEILLRQAHMASMGEMINAIAHQWRQPLMNINVVMMNLDRGIETQKEISYLKEKVLEVFSLTSHMSNTIEDFRNLLKIGKEKKYFLIKDVMYNVITLIKNNLKDIKIIYDLDNKVKIKSYESEFSQVLIILLCNASEVLYAKGIKEKKIYISVRGNEDQIIIGIEDNAGGIEDKNLSKIFDPYFTTKKQAGGTGLGLYIASIIIGHNMQGKLEVSNTEIGALFTIKVPITL